LLCGLLVALLVEITFSSVMLALGGVVILAVIVAYFWVSVRSNVAKNWEGEAKAWQAKAERIEGEKAELQKEKEGLLKKMEGMQLELQECAQLRKDFTQHVLRTEAREERFHTCINRLERRLGIEETDFEDPTKHITQNPNL
jgi:uncharacterized protein (UPF0335 family)